MLDWVSYFLQQKYMSSKCYENNNYLSEEVFQGSSFFSHIQKYNQIFRQSSSRLNLSYKVLCLNRHMVARHEKKINVS